MQDKLFKVLLILSAIVIPVIGGGIIYSLTVDASGAFEEFGFWHFIFSDDWVTTAGKESYGALPFITGTLLTTALALLMCIPFSLPVALFTGEYFRGKKIAAVLGTVIDLLAGIPSIVYGFFGLVVIVPMVQKLTGSSGKGLLTASLLLGMMILPTIIGVAETSIRAVPESYYEGSLALGATHERSVFFAQLPAATSGVMSGVILGVGRAIGETMAVIMIAGNQPIMPRGLLEGLRTMTANVVLEMGYASGLHRRALIATGVVLFVFILIINTCFSLLKRRDQR